MISVSDLTVRLGGTTVVEDVSFEVPEGGSLALWGDNGAGKTTIIRAILGQVPYRGSITVAGHDARRDGRAARAMLGYVPQRLALYDELSSIGLLRFIAALRRAPKDEAEARLERVGLTEHAGKAVGALSGGMRQRLALAAALIGDPPLLILDEPTASLDARARADVLGLLAGLRASGKTLLVTSHRISEIRAVADRAIVLEHGRIRVECPAHALEAEIAPTSILRIMLPREVLDEAVAVLVAGGFDARRNGRGVHVRVPVGRRAEPLSALWRAGIDVGDLSLEDAP